MEGQQGGIILHNQKIKRMALTGLLMALVIVLQLLSGIIPPVGGFSISLVLIPIVLGAALLGPAVGALLGATFSVVVIINCITGADVGGAMVFQANPVLCILVVMTKGTLAGYVSGLVYAKLSVSKLGDHVAMVCAAIVCPVVNTGVFVACMLAFFKDVLAAWAGGGDIIAYVLTGLVVANFIPELAINIVFSPASVRIKRVVKK